MVVKREKGNARGGGRMREKTKMKSHGKCVLADSQVNVT